MVQEKKKQQKNPQTAILSLLSLKATFTSIKMTQRLAIIFINTIFSTKKIGKRKCHIVKSKKKVITNLFTKYRIFYCFEIPSF